MALNLTCELQFYPFNNLDKYKNILTKSKYFNYIL